MSLLQTEGESVSESMYLNLRGGRADDRSQLLFAWEFIIYIGYLAGLNPKP